MAESDIVVILPTGFELGTHNPPVVYVPVELTLKEPEVPSPSLVVDAIDTDGNVTSFACNESTMSLFTPDTTILEDTFDSTKDWFETSDSCLKAFEEII